MKYSTRKTMKKVVISGLVLSGLLGTTALAVQPSALSDVPSTAWYVENLEYLHEMNEGIISGYPDGTFKPKNTLTRVQFAKMVLTALGLSGEISGRSEGYPYNIMNIADAYGMNIYHNLDANTWNQPINRADMADMAMMGLYKIKGIAIDKETNISNALKDKNELEKNFADKADAVYEAMSVGIIKGVKEEGSAYVKFNPAANMTRDESTSIIANMLKYINGESLTKVEIPEKSYAETVTLHEFDGNEIFVLDDGKKIIQDQLAIHYTMPALLNTRFGKDVKGYYVIFQMPEIEDTLEIQAKDVAPELREAYNRISGSLKDGALQDNEVYRFTNIKKFIKDNNIAFKVQVVNDSKELVGTACIDEYSAINEYTGNKVNLDYNEYVTLQPNEKAKIYLRNTAYGQLEGKSIDELLYFVRYQLWLSPVQKDEEFKTTITMGASSANKYVLVENGRRGISSSLTKSIRSEYITQQLREMFIGIFGDNYNPEHE